MNEPNIVITRHNNRFDFGIGTETACIGEGPYTFEQLQQKVREVSDGDVIVLNFPSACPHQFHSHSGIDTSGRYYHVIHCDGCGTVRRKVAYWLSDAAEAVWDE